MYSGALADVPSQCELKRFRSLAIEKSRQTQDPADVLRTWIGTIICDHPFDDDAAKVSTPGLVCRPFAGDQPITMKMPWTALDDDARLDRELTRIGVIVFLKDRADTMILSAVRRPFRAVSLIVT